MRMAAVVLHASLCFVGYGDIYDSPWVHLKSVLVVEVNEKTLYSTVFGRLAVLAVVERVRNSVLLEISDPDFGLLLACRMVVIDSSHRARQADF